MPPRSLPIDEVAFLEALGRDVDFHDTCPQSVYLDLETGDLLWLYDDDEDASSERGITADDNVDLRERVAGAPDRFLLVPGLGHGDHHDILREFLDSDWTDDEDLRAKVRDAYPKSIGGWKQIVDDEEVAYTFDDFRQRAIKNRAEKFLRQHGIEPRWR